MVQRDRRYVAKNGRRVAGEKVRSSDRAGNDGTGTLLDDSELGLVSDSQAVHTSSRLCRAANLRPGDADEEVLNAKRDELQQTLDNLIRVTNGASNREQ